MSEFTNSSMRSTENGNRSVVIKNATDRSPRKIENDALENDLTDSDTPSSLGFPSDPNEKGEVSQILMNATSPDKSLRPKGVDRKESYKAQRKSYAKEKKRVEQELLSTFKDQSIIVLADWLKVRGTLKGWTRLWCVLKPGLLLLYRSEKLKSSHWVGTIILSTCELIERPSKKDGFCFKLFHPMDQSIWAARGPEGETMGAMTQPLPTSHLIFRAPNNAAGKCWMDALELALRCSSLLLRTMSSANAGAINATLNSSLLGQHDEAAQMQGSQISDSTSEQLGNTLRLSLNESEVEKKHFQADIESVSDEDLLDDDEETGKGNESDFSEDVHLKDNRSETSADNQSEVACLISDSEPPEMTTYIPDPSGEIFGTEKDQTQEISDENKSIIWFLIKQVRPGMDLSKVVLPTFILEPRSFLDKLSDYYYHADILSEAVKEDEPFNRMKSVVRWYLSGFYKKPKGLKKPYNPILGETYRCFWEHPNGSKTYYIAEQVSHHPPISAFYVTNRQEGFTVSSTILAKSKFYGNSTSAILEGTATLTLLPRGEEYFMTMPYAHCKGILMGTMTVELGGKVTIECNKTGYCTEIEFKLRPFLGGGEFTNAINGRIMLGKETLASLRGRWDEKILIKDKKSGKEEVFWEVSPEVKQRRLKRFIVPLEDQGEFESARLWKKVSDAIEADDQHAATEEKSALEDAQRAAAKERKLKGFEWVPKYFDMDSDSDNYIYVHSDLRPWDPMNDLQQYEHNYIVGTRTMHKTPMIRTQSIVSVSEAVNISASASLRRRRNTKERILKNGESVLCETTTGNQSTPQKCVVVKQTDFADGPRKNSEKLKNHETSFKQSDLKDLLAPIEDRQVMSNEKLVKLQRSVDALSRRQRECQPSSNDSRWVLLAIVLAILAQGLIQCLMAKLSAHFSASVGSHES